jgi:hypothetical protein
MTTAASIRHQGLAALVAASVSAPRLAAAPEAWAPGCEGAACYPGQQGQGTVAPAVPPTVTVDIREMRSGDLYRVATASSHPRLHASSRHTGRGRNCARLI